MKKFVSIITSFILVLSLTACGPKSNTGSANAQTIMGKVTAVDGNSITIAIVSQDNSAGTSSDGQGNIIIQQQGNVPPDGNGQGGNGENGQGGNGEQVTPPPDLPDGENGQGGNGEQGTPPPDLPDGENGQGGNGEQGTPPPDLPDGENGQGENGENGQGGNGEQGTPPPDLPDGENGQGGNQSANSDGLTLTGETKTIVITDTSILYKKQSSTETSASLSDIVIGSILTITYNENSQMTKIVISSENDSRGNGGGGTTPGGNTSEVVYGGAKEITSATEETDGTYTSTTTDESAILISTTDAVTLNNPTVSKSGDSNGGDNCNFYGQNATILVKDGSTTTINGGTITSNANGANGVFSYGGNGGQNEADGDGTTVIITDSEITTTGNGSGGIMTTGGGTTNATNLTVTTSGQSSAAIRTDRGGGTVTVTRGTYTTNGLGSPAIYSTAKITVNDATLVSNLSEGVCIEGLNSIVLNNSNLTANNTQCNGNAQFFDTIMIYQSMSGDASSGTSTFTMNGGSLTSKNGHVFHVTNTSAIISLKGVTITNEDSENVLLSVCDDGWSGGQNIATVNAENQTLDGKIFVGDESSLTLNLVNSTFNGCVCRSVTNANEQTISSTTASVSVTLDSDSTWTLSADSYITEFTGDATNVISNGFTLYVNGTALAGTR